MALILGRSALAVLNLLFLSLFLITALESADAQTVAGGMCSTEAGIKLARETCGSDKNCLTSMCSGGSFNDPCRSANEKIADALLKSSCTTSTCFKNAKECDELAYAAGDDFDSGGNYESYYGSGSDNMSSQCRKMVFGQEAQDVCEKKKDLEKKQTDYRKELADANKNAQKDMQQLKNRAKDLNKEFTNAKTEAEQKQKNLIQSGKEALAELDRDMQKQISQLQNEQLSLDDQVAELQGRSIELSVNYKNQIIEMDIKCQEAADNAFNQAMENRQRKIENYLKSPGAKDPRNRGGLNSLSGTRKAGETMRRDVYVTCSNNNKKKFRQLTITFEGARSQANVRLQQIEKRRAMSAKALQDLIAKLPERQKEIAEKIQLAQEQLQQNFQTLAQNYQQDVASLNEEAQTTQQTAAEESSVIREAQMKDMFEIQQLSAAQAKFGLGTACSTSSGKQAERQEKKHQDLLTSYRTISHWCGVMTDLKCPAKAAECNQIGATAVRPGSSGTTSTEKKN